jgi:hypothetical protein
MAKTKADSALTFNYLKSNFFRVIHVDGAIGGFTPGGFVHMTVYSERVAIPKSTTYEVTKGEGLGDEIDRDSLEGIVREMEADLIFNIEAAVALRDWLDNKINASKEIQQGN